MRKKPTVSCTVRYIDRTHTLSPPVKVALFEREAPGLSTTSIPIVPGALWTHAASAPFGEPNTSKAGSPFPINTNNPPQAGAVISNHSRFSHLAAVVRLLSGGAGFSCRILFLRALLQISRGPGVSHSSAWARIKMDKDPPPPRTVLHQTFCQDKGGLEYSLWRSWWWSSERSTSGAMSSCRSRWQGFSASPSRR